MLLLFTLSCPSQGKVECCNCLCSSISARHSSSATTTCPHLPKSKLNLSQQVRQRVHNGIHQYLCFQGTFQLFPTPPADAFRLADVIFFTYVQSAFQTAISFPLVLGVSETTYELLKRGISILYGTFRSLYIIPVVFSKTDILEGLVSLGQLLEVRVPDMGHQPLLRFGEAPVW